jgi:hypothetical protein
MALGLAAGALVMIGVCAATLRTMSRAVASQNHPVQEVRVEARSASSDSPPTELPSPPVVAEPAPELPSKSPPKPGTSTTAVRGTKGVTRATYRFGSGIYNAIIHTNGPTGYADVRFVDPMQGPVVVREDLRLQEGPRGFTYVGSNPRYVDDGSPANFIPNLFYMEQGTFVETCALGTGKCARMVSESVR